MPKIQSLVFIDQGSGYYLQILHDPFTPGYKCIYWIYLLVGINSLGPVSAYPELRPRTQLWCFVTYYNRLLLQSMNASHHLFITTYSNRFSRFW